MILDVFYCDVAESIHQVSESHVQWSSRLRTSQRTLVPEDGGAQRFNPDILVTESFTTCFFLETIWNILMHQTDPHAKSPTV